MSPLLRYLRHMGETFPEMTYEEIVLKAGRSFSPQERPPQYRKGLARQCFMNCTKYIIDHEEEGLVYVEGFAFSIIPVHHAWLTDRSGNVIELTWDTPGEEYIGIPLKRDFVISTTIARGYYGVMEHYGFASDKLSELRQNRHEEFFI